MSSPEMSGTGVAEVGAALDNVTKVFAGTGADPTVAVDHLDLAVDTGEVLVVVGPSGCGKSTVLRLFAGLEPPTSGRVLLDGVDVTDLAPNLRDVGLCAQQDLPLLHRTARDLLTTSARRSGLRDRSEIDGLVERTADELGVANLLDRPADRLARGERRAVLVTSALLGRPSLLALDEPLAFMDDQLARRVRLGLLGLVREGCTALVVVTADQQLATAIGDRIAVLFEGRLHQLGSARDVRERPATTEVAEFFGDPPMNVWSAPVRVDDHGRRTASVLGVDVPVWSPELAVYDGRTVTVRLAAADLAPGDSAHPTVEVEVVSAAPLGHCADVVACSDRGVTVRVRLDADPPRRGDRIRVAIRGDRIHWFDPATGLAILHPAVG